MSSGEPWLSRIWMYATRRMRHVNNEARLMSAWQRWQKSGYPGGKVPLVRLVVPCAAGAWPARPVRSAEALRSFVTEQTHRAREKQRCWAPLSVQKPAVLVTHLPCCSGSERAASKFLAGTKLLVTTRAPRVAQSGERPPTGIHSLYVTFDAPRRYDVGWDRPGTPPRPSAARHRREGESRQPARCRRRPRALRHFGPARARHAGRSREPGSKRRSRLLFRQPAHQPNERLHPAQHVHLLLFRADAEGRGRLHALAGGGIPRGRTGDRHAHARVPHRRWAPPEAPSELLHRHDSGVEGASSWCPHQGTHCSRNRSPGAHREDLRA